MRPQLLDFFAHRSIMIFRAGALAAFSFLVSCANGIPASEALYRRAALDDWITNQTANSVAGLLANIGSTGAKSYGAAQGLVLASPSTTNPDCRYTL